MKFALPPRFLRRLRELPVKEPRSEPAGHWLRVIRAFVVAETKVCQTNRLWQHPALAIVLGKKREDAVLQATATLIDPLLQVIHRWHGKHSRPEFRISQAADAP